jgi:hypothetical protein
MSDGPEWHSDIEIGTIPRGSGIVEYRPLAQSAIAFDFQRLQAASMSIRSVIVEQVGRVAEQQQTSLPPLTDDLPMLAFDSLFLAILIASLDESLGLDPFANNEAVSFPTSFGDLVSLYEHAAA